MRWWHDSFCFVFSASSLFYLRCAPSKLNTLFAIVTAYFSAAETNPQPNEVSRRRKYVGVDTAMSPCTSDVTPLQRQHEDEVIVSQTEFSSTVSHVYVHHLLTAYPLWELATADDYFLMRRLQEFLSVAIFFSSRYFSSDHCLMSSKHCLLGFTWIKGVQLQTLVCI